MRPSAARLGAASGCVRTNVVRRDRRVGHSSQWSGERALIVSRAGAGALVSMRPERYRAAMALRATVRNGRLTLDEPTELPEGTVMDLVIDDEGDELDEGQRRALHSAIDRSLEQASKRQTAPADAILAKLRSRRGG